MNILNAYEKTSPDRTEVRANMVIGVWHKNGTGLPGLLRRLTSMLPELGGSHVADCPEVCDVLISDGPAPDVFHPCRCRLAVVPGDAPFDASFVTADRVITYGMSCRNTVTVSSVSDGRLFLALQREIIGIDGQSLDQQELLVRHAPSTVTALAASAALLACGAAPESLEKLFKK
ncbi:MAG: hypothetical protein FWH06_02975 [Oscillospiraceae bacterium]|nr:hypothetical protein [Oscillospiraceae bacterium]